MMFDCFFLSPYRKKNTTTNRRGRTSRRVEVRKKLKDYYNGTWNSTPTASILYAMASQVNRGDNDSLWWAIIGLTDQWIHGKLSLDNYGRLSMELGQAVERINPKLDELQHRKSKGTIQSEDEYRFVLFRHWSLYESMYHSGYVASKLGTWREKGKKRLANFLAKMG